MKRPYHKPSAIRYKPYANPMRARGGDEGQFSKRDGRVALHIDRYTVDMLPLAHIETTSGQQSGCFGLDTFCLNPDTHK